MQRPIGVTLTAILMVVNIFLDVALPFISPTVTMTNERSGGPALSTVLIALHIALAALIAFQFIVVLYYWLGRFWARWFVLVGCIYYLVGLKDLISQWHLHHSYATAGLTLGSAALALYLIWYLHTADVRDWFARSTIAAFSASPAIDK